MKITPEEQQQLREGKVIFLNDMVNRKGEEFSSFIKADLETGRLSYSRTPDGFEQRAEFKIPDKVWDVQLNRQQRADLQSGKTVLVEGIKGYDGKTISQYVKANFNQGRLDFYNENPDRKRDASQRNVVANAQKQGQERSRAAADPKVQAWPEVKRMYNPKESETWKRTMETMRLSRRKT